MTAWLRQARAQRFQTLLAPVLRWQLFEVCAYGLLALPVLTATTDSGIGHFPDPARLLFSDGGLWLLELLHQQRSQLLASFAGRGWLLSLVICAELVPEWRLLRTLALRRCGEAQPARPVLVRLGVLTLLLWMLRGMSLLPLLLLGLLQPGFTVRFDARVLDLALLCAFGLWLLLQLVLSVLRDLAAVRSVFAPGSLRTLLRRTLEALSARGGRLTLRYGAYRALALATVLGGELLLLALPGAGLATAWTGLVVHQGALFARLMLRGLWLAELGAEFPGGLRQTPSRAK
jgi:hypothetical protein